uniref:Macro domain-containing protein n=1 Tax=Scophthalmus maximus TaxID=52904 RepID=A0A8D3E9I3_SCOMX
MFLFFLELMQQFKVTLCFSVDDKEEEKELMGGGGLSDKVSLYKGDITVLEVDAIVNAANSSLLGGGGVDGCIHKAAGSCLYDECHSLNGCDTGKAKITCGYDLPAKYVIHTVGPVARGHVGPTETNDLTSCYQNSLRLMKEHGLSTVFSLSLTLSLSQLGFPNEPAADIALNTISRVIFCVFLETDFTIYKKQMSVIFQGMCVFFKFLSTDSGAPPRIELNSRGAERGWLAGFSILALPPFTSLFPPQWNTGSPAFISLLPDGECFVSPALLSSVPLPAQALP